MAGLPRLSTLFCHLGEAKTTPIPSKPRNETNYAQKYCQRSHHRSGNRLCPAPLKSKKAKFYRILEEIKRQHRWPAIWRLDSAEMVSPKAYPPCCQHLLSNRFGSTEFPREHLVRERRVGGLARFEVTARFDYLSVAAGDDGSDSLMREPLERSFVGKLDATSKR
jgi:hypothetical protein